VEALLAVITEFLAFYNKLIKLRDTTHYSDTDKNEFIDFALLISNLKKTCKMYNMEFPAHLISG